MRNKFFNFPTELVEEITIWAGGVIAPECRWIGNIKDARLEYHKRLIQNGFEETNFTSGRKNHTMVSVDGLYEKIDEKTKEKYLYYYTIDSYKRGKHSGVENKHYIFKLHKFPEMLIQALCLCDEAQIPYYHFIQGPRTINITTKR